MMNDKIKYRPSRGEDKIEFKDKVVYIELPNGLQLSLQYNHIEEGLVINKIGGAGDSSMTIKPHVSNQVLIK